MALQGSAAWTVSIVSVLTFLVGAILLTVLDPVAQAVFESSLWSPSTSAGQMATGAVQSMWTYWSLFILLGIMFLVWVKTRRAG